MGILLFGSSQSISQLPVFSCQPHQPLVGQGYQPDRLYLTQNWCRGTSDWLKNTWFLLNKELISTFMRLQKSQGGRWLSGRDRWQWSKAIHPWCLSTALAPSSKLQERGEMFTGNRDVLGTKLSETSGTNWRSWELEVCGVLVCPTEFNPQESTCCMHPSQLFLYRVN